MIIENSNSVSWLRMLGLSGCVMLLYYCLNFPSAIMLCIGLGFGVWNIIQRKRMEVELDASLVAVAIFCVSFFTLDSYIGYSTTMAFAYGLNIILIYIVGRNWLNGDLGDEDKIVRTIYLIAAAITFYIWACIFYTAVKDPGSLAARQFLSVWDGALVAATHFSTMSTLPLAVYFLMLFQQKKATKRFGLAGLVLVVVSNCIMSNRVIFIFICVIGVLCLFLGDGRKAMAPKVMALIVFGLSVSAFVFLYGSNAFGIQGLLGSIPVFSRMNDLTASGYEDPRLDRQMYILAHLFDSTSGGGYFCNVVGEPHNVFLDVYDYAGWFPAVVFLLFCITLILHLVDGRKQSKSYSVNLLIVAVASVLLSFVEEPVFRSCECYFVLFFFLAGLSFAAWGSKVHSGKASTNNLGARNV